MDRMNEIIDQVMAEINGFRVKEKLAGDFVENHPMDECLEKAKEFFGSGHYQLRMFAVFISGGIAHESKEALEFLEDEVSKDADWRVHEILAKAFCMFYAAKGFRDAFPVLEEWISNENPNLRRAATEGLRVWTDRDYFKDHPERAIRLLSIYKDDDSEYVRKSVGNALKDISKEHQDLVMEELEEWDLTDEKVAQTYKLASKFIGRADYQSPSETCN